MLKHMFADRERPLYALCDTLHLQRLPAEHYERYLNSIAHKTWGGPLPSATLHEILAITERHPRYVYYLCRELWETCSHHKKPPTRKIILNTWLSIVHNHLKDSRTLLSRRSPTQIKLLTMIATGQNSELTGQATTSQLGVSGSAVVQALRHLEEEDFIEKRDDRSYRIIDPLLKSTLKLTASS